MSTMWFYVVLGVVACIVGCYAVVRMTGDKYSDMMGDPEWTWLIIGYCLLMVLGAVMLADGLNELVNLQIVRDVYGK